MYKIRNLESADYFKGFLKLLEHLTLTGDMHKTLFENILKKVNLNPYHFVFVMLNSDETKIIGTITVLMEWKFIHGGAQVCHVEDVVICPDYQGKGLGRELLSYVKNWVKESYPHCYKIILDCKEENVKFYKKCDFKQNGFEMRYNY